MLNNDEFYEQQNKDRINVENTYSQTFTVK